MSDDKTKEDYRDREKVSASEDYEVDYFAKKHGLSRERTLQLIREHDGDRRRMEGALRT